MINLLSHQKKPVEELVSIITEQLGRSKPRGPLIVGGMGSGKTFVWLETLLRLQSSGRLNSVPRPGQFSSVMIVTAKNVVENHKRECYKHKLKSFEVVSSSSLRSTFGELYGSWHSIWRNGREEEFFQWDTTCMPDLILISEIQFLKNKDTKAVKVIDAFIAAGGLVFSESATPYQKAIEMYLVSRHTGLVTDEEDFKLFCNQISPGGPTINSPLAVKRMREQLERCGMFIELTNVRYPFKPKFHVVRLNFTSAEQKREYDRAEAEYLEERRKKQMGDPQGIRKLWVAMQKFEQKAELLRAQFLAEEAIKLLGEKAVIITFKYQATGAAVWQHLVKLGIDKKRIAVCSGGLNNQKAIDDFQNGTADIFLNSIKSGGVGINIQQHEGNKHLVKPRDIIMPVTWSVFDMLQAAYRPIRINSVSGTNVHICMFKGTIEMEIADRLETKFDCIRELVKNKDNFIANIFNREIDKEINNMIVEELETELAEAEKKEEEAFSFNINMIED